jgi:hypothetical protein
MRIASSTVALTTLFLSLTSAIAQTDVTCHINPFNTVSGPTLSHESTANSSTSFHFLRPAFAGDSPVDLWNKREPS